MIDVSVNPAFVVFSAISPLLIALVKQQGFSPEINSLIALAGYVVVGILGALTSGTPLTIENGFVLITIATVVGSATYNLIWNNLLVTSPTALSLDKRITRATSFIK